MNIRLKKLIIFTLIFPIAGMIISCHNLDVPLENNIPIVLFDSCVERNIYYPDTTVCTLSVHDLNDSVFTLYSAICDTIGVDSIFHDTVDWQGHYFQYNNSGTKKIILTLPGMLMGSFNGTFLITDEQGVCVGLPYTIQKEFRDTVSSQGLNVAMWRTYCANNDVDHITQFALHKNYLMKFILDKSQGSTKTGMVCRYGLIGDFCISIDFGLLSIIPKILKHVRIGFFVSTSPDSAKYAGIEAGIYIRGIENSVNVHGEKGLISSLQSLNYNYGNMKIERVRDSIALYCWQENKLLPPPLIKVHFYEGDTLYVHVKMKVEDLDYTRYCTWDNFYIHSGKIEYFDINRRKR